MDVSAIRGQYLRILGVQAYALKTAEPAPKPHSPTAASQAAIAATGLPPTESAATTEGPTSKPSVGESATVNPAPSAAIVPTPRPAAPPAAITAPEHSPAAPISFPEPPPAPEPITAFDPPSWAPSNLPQFDRNLPRFTLCFSQFGERLLVIYDASHHKHTVDAADQQLLARVSYALWQEQLTSRVNAYIWPQLPPTAKIDLSVRVARSAVQAYFQQRRSKSQVPHILILGRVPACYILSLEQLQQDFTSLRGQPHQIDNSTLVVSEDMQLLQSQPASKRQAWQEMQLLLGARPSPPAVK